MKSYLIFAVPALLGIAVACSSSETTNPGTTTDAGNTDTAVAVTEDAAPPTDSGSDSPSGTGTALTAAAGGKVTLPGGALDVPAGALASDTTITSVAAAATAGTPDSATVLGSVYDLGPTGTTFTKPVLLSLSTGTVPGGKQAVISVLDGAKWVDLPSVILNGKIHASLSHFSTYAVRGVNAVQCASFDTKVACGTGTVTGTWNVSAFCNAEFDTYEFPATTKLLAACAATGQISPITGGTATLNADLTITHTIVKPTKGTLTIALPSECTSTAASCDAVAAQIMNEDPSLADAACTGAPATGCSCTGAYKPPVLPAPISGSYTLNAGKLGVKGIPERSYCVNAGLTPQEFYYSWGSGASTQFGWVFTK